MDETRVQIKLVAVADIHLKAGQDIDATITVPEHGITTSEIATNLVMMFHALPDPSKATGYAAMMAEQEIDRNKLKNVKT
jgi:hypothetical protein